MKDRLEPLASLLTWNLETDDLSFRSLMLEHQSMVFSMALRILDDRQAAEEVAQDVFLELHTRLHDLKSEDHIRNWLRRVTVHRSIDRVRQRERRPEVAMDWNEVPDRSNRSSEVLEPDPLLTRQLQQLIGSLPAVPRSVLVMRYQEDMSPEEIAVVLEMPVATVKSHLQRTLRLLREKAARVLR